ncbi:PD-(D/E)XK nuclease family protein [Virgibacillus sp. SK37]|uniref:PD-(D/E)XK nuclease family protein n=1 Tax=Virgibacillus sp. SK37 TaxID=403957 RepID=UPI0004D0D8B2|nr:PD-(D/E)XK nuclease family protein [Virgibacillus sp. SK37]AIF45545.1 hypothetical protein X953_16245 [Virgibacillus sp. SK37]
MDNVFINLLKLHGKQGFGVRTPLEDFTTEIFAYILSQDNAMIDLFMNHVLKVPGEKFRVRTQGRYIVEEECVIDMVFENNETICFLENKVHASEGERQLERYLTVLHSFLDRKVYLRYCTKYYDPKDITELDFKQIRWRDVYTFLQKNSKEDSLIKAFLEFMEVKGMAGEGVFNYQDILVMNQLNTTLAKMDDLLEDMLPMFTTYFGEPKAEQSGKRLKGIHNYTYEVWKGDVLAGRKDPADSRISIGFEFCREADMATDMVYPVIYLAIECTNGLDNFDLIKQRLEMDEFFDLTDSDETWVSGWFEKPLSDFLPLEHQFGEIEKWFREKMEALMVWKENTPELGWQV